MAPKFFVTRRWRWPKVILALFLLEFPLTVACLAFFGIADPDTYRTKLWQNGADQGFNSSPSEILYAFANYKPISVPLVWSSFLTQFNVVISVLSMFVLLVKSTMFVMHIFLPIISLLVHAILIAVYSVGLHNQSSPDLSDPQHPSPGLPWYLSKGCQFATEANKGYCLQARASFAVTCVMIALFAAYFFLAIHSMFPTAAEKADREAENQSDIELKSAVYGYEDGLSKEERWERNRQIFMNLPKTPNTGVSFAGMGQSAMTPRTTAFSKLSGANMGEPSAIGRNAEYASRGPSKPLAFREQYG